MNRGNTGYPSQNHNHSQQSTNLYQQSPNRQHNDNFNPAQKRPHATAFDNQPTSHHNVTRSRPLAPPAVPSFGIDFNALLPKKPEPQNSTTATVPSPVLKKANLLGLTPVVKLSNPESESESDAEEESKLADALSTNPNILTFEYNGQPASLSTPEEIASWIAERRKKWPTEAKRETARQQAEERKKKYEAEKADRLEASKVAAKARQVERETQRVEKEKSLVRQKLLREQIMKAAAKAKEKNQGDTTVVQSTAQIKAEKLRRKAAKIAQKLKLAELALEKQTQEQSPDIIKDEASGDMIQKADKEVNETDIDTLLAQVDQIAAAQQNPDADLTALDANLNIDTDIDSDTTSDPDSIADDTSTSGSSDSDSDSDAPPEQLSSKSAPNPLKPPRTDTRPLCANYTKTGRCKFGRRCHFRHEKPVVDRKAGNSGKASGKRKGLYQVMVDKEVEEERRRVVRAIIGLGEAGWLDEEGETKVSGK